MMRFYMLADNVTQRTRERRSGSSIKCACKFSMVSTAGVEEIGLAYGSNVSSINTQPVSHSAESYPNSASGAMSSNNDTASRAVHLNLLHAILSGPFHGALLERKYVELNDESLSLAE